MATISLVHSFGREPSEAKVTFTLEFEQQQQQQKLHTISMTARTTHWLPSRMYIWHVHLSVSQVVIKFLFLFIATSIQLMFDLLLKSSKRIEINKVK